MRLFALVLLLMTTWNAHAQTVSVPRAMIIELSDLIRKNEQRASGKIPYRAAKMIEVLLYRAEWIEDAIERNQPYQVSIGKQTIQYRPETQTLTFRDRRYLTSVTRIQDALVFDTSDHEDLPAPIPLASLNYHQLEMLEDEIYNQTLGSRGYQTQYLKDQSPSVELAQAPKEFTLNIQEKWAKDGSFEGSKWALLPVRFIAWPAQKILYEIPSMMTNTLMESAIRSPKHNFLGATDEFRGAGKLAWNGIKDMVRGIIHPRRATFFDGTFELLDVAFKLTHGALGLAKSAISVVAYPIHRLFGGMPSQRVSLRGKRAVIILIDSMATSLIDTYGEMIVRSKVKSLSDYYCVTTPTEGETNDINECIDRMPPDIQYLDVISLQHSGGGEDAESYAKYAAKRKGVRPELLLSIGCYDDPSRFGEGENVLGQMGTSWAVHYYFANLLEKRLRGAPAHQAGVEAFNEGFLTNAIDPISWGGVLVIGAIMESDLKEGYFGSEPKLISPDQIVLEVIDQSRGKPELAIFRKKIEDLVGSGKITLKQKTLKLLQKAT